MSPIATMVPSMGHGPGGATGTRVAEGLHVPLLLRRVVSFYCFGGDNDACVTTLPIPAFVANHPRDVARIEHTRGTKRDKRNPIHNTLFHTYALLAKFGVLFCEDIATQGDELVLFLERRFIGRTRLGGS